MILKKGEIGCGASRSWFELHTALPPLAPFHNLQAYITPTLNNHIPTTNIALPIYGIGMVTRHLKFAANSIMLHLSLSTVQLCSHR
jgi:hypothetical protein